MLYEIFKFLCIVYFTKCAPQYINESILYCGLLKYKFNILQEDSRHSNGQFSLRVQSAVCVLLSAVFTNVSISDFSPIVNSYIKLHVMNRNKSLHSDCYLFLQPAAPTDFLATDL